MINYDGRTSYGTPSYYVQRLFSRNQGTSLLGTGDDITRGPRSRWSARGDASLNIINAPFTVNRLTITDLDHDGAVLQQESGIEMTPDGTATLPLDLAGCEHFRIDLDFTAHEKLDPESSGTDVTIRFAETSPDDYVALAINSWWGRMLTLRTYQHGKESYYSAIHVNYAAETTHRALLEFDHGTVSLVMDGKPMLNETLLPYEPDDLYYSAVRDADDTVTVKLVNVKDTPADVRLAFDHAVDATYSVEHMDGFALDARNDLEHPARVASSERTEHAGDAATEPMTALDYHVPAHAVHVLKFRVD
ncbi:alpha-L-arabinofuranosidase C-terminal domain-containing protein [Bifidobacterium aerophilum]|nr:alpha-L-arabinofuranosidase C-terminal domain-containing protein [Bifidobacterium aerophilum]